MAIKETDLADMTAGWALSADAPPAVPDASQAWGAVGESYGVPVDEGFLPQREQVAGLGSAISGGILRSMRRGTRGIIESVQKPGTVSPEEQATVERVLRDVRNKAIPEGQRTRRTAIEAAKTGEPPVPLAEGAPPQRPLRGESGEFNLERAHPGASEQDYVTLASLAEQDPKKILRMVENSEQLGDALDVIGEQFLKAPPRTFEQIRSSGVNFDNVAASLKQEGLLNDRQLYAVRTLLSAVGDETVNLARKIYQGDRAPETLLKYEQAGQSLIALTRFTKNQTREVARALSQQRMISGALDAPDLQALQTALQQSADPQALVKNASALVRAIDEGRDPTLALSESLERRTLFEATVEFWKANNLSAIPTHVANTLSGVTATLHQALVRPVAAVIGETRGLLGAKSHYTSEELAYSVVGGMRGLYDSVGMSLDTLLSGHSALATAARREVESGAIHDVVGSRLGMTPEWSEALFTPAFRLMRATDEAIMVPAYRAETAGLAARDGVKQGLQGEDLAAHVEKLLDNVPQEIHVQAIEMARKVTMQNRTGLGVAGIMSEHLYAVAQRLPLLHFVTPWIRTPGRIIDYMVESSALAVASPRTYKQLMSGGPEADIAAAKIVVGLGITASLYPYIDSYQITGAGPEDPEQLAAWRAQGWEPFSFKVGDKYISYKNWADPVMGMIAGIATGVERAKASRTEHDKVRLVMESTAGAAEYITETSYAEGFKDLFKMLSDPVDRAPRYVARMSTGFVPYGSFLASVARSQISEEEEKPRTYSPLGFGGEDMLQDMYREWREEFALRLPGLRDTLRPARYWDGKIIVPANGEIASMISPIKVRDIEKDKASFELSKHGTRVNEPSPIFMLPGQAQINLLDLDKGVGKVYDSYIKDIGEARRQAVSLILESSGYSAQTDSQQALTLDEAIAEGTEIGRKKFLGETLPKLAQEGKMEAGTRLLGYSPEAFIEMLRKGIKPVRAVTPESRQVIDVGF